MTGWVFFWFSSILVLKSSAFFTVSKVNCIRIQPLMVCLQHFVGIILLVNKSWTSTLLQCKWMHVGFETIKISQNFGLDKNAFSWNFTFTFLYFHFLCGILDNGVKVALKKLMHLSNHGKEQFLNEVKLIWILQHQNLVRIIYCSIREEDDSRFLMYDYVSNQSLNEHLFGNTSNGPGFGSNRTKPLSHGLKAYKFQNI